MIYLASPFSTEEQRDDLARLEALFDELRLEYFSPRTNVPVLNGLPPETRRERSSDWFKTNISNLDRSYCLLFCSDFYDADSAFDLGYAYSTYCKDKSVAILTYSKSGQTISNDTVAAVSRLHLMGFEEAEGFFTFVKNNPKYNIELPGDLSVTSSYLAAVWLDLVEMYQTDSKTA